MMLFLKLQHFYNVNLLKKLIGNLISQLILHLFQQTKDYYKAIPKFCDLSLVFVFVLKT